MTTEPLTVPRPPTGWRPLDFRWCGRCRLFTECGLCPLCFDRLGDQSRPRAAPLVRGELDVAPPARFAGVRGQCQVCRYALPFHASSDCPGAVTSPPSAGAATGSARSRTSAPAPALPAGPAHHQEAP